MAMLSAQRVGLCMLRRIFASTTRLDVSMVDVSMVDVSMEDLCLAGESSGVLKKPELRPTPQLRDKDPVT